jgi:hypothetical protein
VFEKTWFLPIIVLGFESKSVFLMSYPISGEDSKSQVVDNVSIPRKIKMNDQQLLVREVVSNGK